MSTSNNSGTDASLPEDVPSTPVALESETPTISNTHPVDDNAETTSTSIIQDIEALKVSTEPPSESSTALHDEPTITPTALEPGDTTTMPETPPIRWRYVRVFPKVIPDEDTTPGPDLEDMETFTLSTTYSIDPATGEVTSSTTGWEREEKILDDTVYRPEDLELESELPGTLPRDPAPGFPDGWTVSPVTVNLCHPERRGVPHAEKYDIAMQQRSSYANEHTPVIYFTWIWKKAPMMMETCLWSLVMVWQQQREGSPDMKLLHGNLRDTNYRWQLYCEKTPLRDLPNEGEIEILQYAYKGRKVFHEKEDREILLEWAKHIPLNEVKKD
ncbi:hypothetical protein ASPCADRAFT_2133 [Aspergillus carbonarius ITEM 5010]|uniref:Uncharacterized protein n=1 Tax=Aspergillus carbonarius (strain ITEM 5010) TaxID=602072 RepID=A0A1R3RW37_ASPC5|nr:hypothetical protein ASPCADRAFT_2133 [Aspergillus carbonarius ITEM 5010]